jgi:hypothetical protein
MPALRAMQDCARTRHPPRTSPISRLRRRTTLSPKPVASSESARYGANSVRAAIAVGLMLGASTNPSNQSNTW